MTGTSTQDKACSLASQALADLAAKLDRGHSDALAEYLRFLGRFHRYSALNVMLIQLQNPEATHVAGFERWKGMGRYVRKGSKGIAILAPCAYRRRTSEDEDKRDPEEGKETVVGYRTAYVFDVSQTDGADLPSIGAVNGDPGLQLNALRALTNERGIRIECRDELGGARGLSTGGKIVLLRGMDPAEEFAVLAHELAHELLHKGERRAETDLRQRELEAEAVSYVVTTAVGLENDTASADYIGLYQGDAKLLAHSLQHVQRVSAEILEYLL